MVLTRCWHFEWEEVVETGGAQSGNVEDAVVAAGPLFFNWVSLWLAVLHFGAQAFVHCYIFYLLLVRVTQLSPLP